MTYVRKIKNAVQWHEGMLLRPQHFQQADRRIEHLFSYYLGTMSTHPWGVLEFSYDKAALVTGLVRILDLEAVLPDGLALSLHQGAGENLSLNLASYDEDLKKRPMTLYISVPEYREGKANAAGEMSRFRSCEKQMAFDENTGDDGVSVPTLHPNVSLVLSEVWPSQGGCLPLLKLQKIENAYQILEFIPPPLKVATDSSLGILCNTLVRRIREKAAFLSERLSSQSSDFMSAEGENALKAFSGGLLPLEAMIGAGVCHPFEVYLQLTNLAGHLSTLFAGQLAPSFSPYDHNDVRESFLQVIRFCEEMLDRIQEGYYLAAFTLENRIFSLTLQPSWMKPQLIVGAKASAKMSEKDVIEWISQAVIATEDSVGPCREKRILGASRTIISEVEELKLMPARDVVLFSVVVSPEFISSLGTLQIFNVADSPEMRPQELVLYIPKTEGQDKGS